MKIRVDELLSALSLSVDLSMRRSLNHSKNTAYIAFRICDSLGLNEKLKHNIYYASFLHDIGIGSISNEITLQDIHNDSKLQLTHCDKAYYLLKILPLDESICDYVLYHHESYDGTGPNMLKGDEIPLGAQIISLADYFDANHMTNDISFNERLKIIEKIKSKKGIKFRQDIVDAFLDVLNTEKFWFDLYLDINNNVLELIKPDRIQKINLYELEEIAQVFANIIDAKSKFTYEHSKGVALRSYQLANIMGFDESKQRMLKVAGYLHDLGKLAIPNEILDKNRKLSPDEYDLIKRHPYYTKAILSQVKCFKNNIARWAGNHHEKISGKGYPERLSKNHLTLEDQIIGVADIYQSLIEDRPYRKGLSKDKAVNILNDVIESGGFDKIFLDAVAELKRY